MNCHVCNEPIPADDIEKNLTIKDNVMYVTCKNHKGRVDDGLEEN